MDRKKIIGFGGAVILFFGLFAPIVKGQLGDTASLLDVWQFFLITLGCLILCTLLLVLNMSKSLLAAAILTLMVNGFWLAAFIGARNDPKYGMSYVSFSWGWAPLLLGPVVMIVSVFFRSGKQEPETGESPD